MVVSAEFKELIGDDGYAWTKLPGKRKFKGISEDQVLFRVRRPEPSSKGQTPG